MCNCAKNAPGVGRRRLSGPRERTLYAVFDGELQVTGLFRSWESAETKRLRLRTALGDGCTLETREAA